MKFGAIDQGTTSSRALMLCDGEAQVRFSAEHAQSMPYPGWVEHDPRELLKNVWAAAEALGDADALGLDNQGESCLAWDRETGEPISQVIVWQDDRTSKVTERLKAEGHESHVKALSGLPLDPYFSASKMAWIIEQVPEAKTLLREGRLALGTTDAFFLQNLVGRCVTDVTTASRTSLMNLQTLQWDAELCDLFGVPMETLPDILSTQDEYGDIEINGHGVPLRANIVDQQAALFGHGCHQPGDAKVTLGTGAFALAISGDCPVLGNAGGLLPTVAWRLGGGAPVFALDGGVYNAGSALNWARSIGLFSTFPEINGFQNPPAIERGLVFVPALSGLACPHWRREARAAFEGLSLDTGPLDMVQAVLEGVALRIAEVIAAMHEITPIGDEISIDGGLANNAYICQFLADVLGRHVRVTGLPELTAIGCARLAGLGLGEEGGSVGGGALYAPKGKARHDWIGRFSQAVARTAYRVDGPPVR